MFQIISNQRKADRFWLDDFFIGAFLATIAKVIYKNSFKSMKNLVGFGWLFIKSPPISRLFALARGALTSPMRLTPKKLTQCQKEILVRVR